MKAAQSMLVNGEPWSERISTRCFGLRRHTAMCSACTGKRPRILPVYAEDHVGELSN